MNVIKFLIYAVARSFFFGARFSPMGFTFWWLRGLSRLAYRFSRRRRELMLWNLEYALGDELTPAQREDIARQSFENMFIAIGELIHLDTIMSKWRDHFSFEGAEIIEGLAERKRGIFGFGGHLGGWPMIAVLRQRFPTIPDFSVVARPLRNPYLQQIMEYLAEKFGGKIISTRGHGELIEARAAQGDMIGFYMDQESRRDQGIFVKFFGHDALSHVVPAYLAWKNQIPLVPGWIIRKRPGYLHFAFQPPLSYELTADKDENNRRVTQAIANEVERAIREHPEQWLWAHNRWRRRPDGTKIQTFEKDKKRSRTKARKRGDYLSSEDMLQKEKPENGGPGPR